MVPDGWLQANCSTLSEQHIKIYVYDKHSKVGGHHDLMPSFLQLQNFKPGWHKNNAYRFSIIANRSNVQTASQNIRAIQHRTLIRWCCDLDDADDIVSTNQRTPRNMRLVATDDWNDVVWWCRLLNIDKTIIWCNTGLLSSLDRQARVDRPVLPPP